MFPSLRRESEPSDEKVAGSIPVWGSETFFWVCDKAWVANSFPLIYQAASHPSYIYITCKFRILQKISVRVFFIEIPLVARVFVEMYRISSDIRHLKIFITILWKRNQLTESQRVSISKRTNTRSSFSLLKRRDLIILLGLINLHTINTPWCSVSLLSVWDKIKYQQVHNEDRILTKRKNYTAR